ncbi:MAG: SulP family inorganic anion transporter [Methylococcaceae bacterium]|nr:SulP family inorganic anion transporter [Methylococcaceae bacterium]
MTQFFPQLHWLKNYTRRDFDGDIFAGVITAILLVPQGIAYASLAGLPPQMGLYASILPTAIYAFLGTSSTLSVGPVSIAAIMIAGALSTPDAIALGNPMQSALILAFECGCIMLTMAIFNMGRLVNFISHPVLAGFTSGAALLIIVSQIPQMAGLKTPSCGFDITCYQLYLDGVNHSTSILSITSLILLIFFGKPLNFLLKKAQVPLTIVTAISKCGPLLIVFLGTLAVTRFDLQSDYGVTVVGQIPSGFPSFNFNFPPLKNWSVLFPSATFIALIAYVETIAIAKVTANLRGEKINPNQELIALGAANLIAATSGGMTVAGGFSRTMVNFSAGARTQMAMIIAAIILGVTVSFFSQWFTNIPNAALSAIIIVAVFRLVRIRHILHTYNYDQGDGIAELATLIGVLILGIEKGITLGILLTLAGQLRKSSQPHIAVVGRVPKTEHYRNIKRHSVETWHHLLLVRIDENLTYANINYVEDYLTDELNRQPNIKHVVLIFTSVSDIDSTALEALETINKSLKSTGKSLNISEAKGPVLDKLGKTNFLEDIKPGKVFFRTEDAAKALG